jgi:hypothetical protein
MNALLTDDIPPWTPCSTTRRPPTVPAWRSPLGDRGDPRIPQGTGGSPQRKLGHVAITVYGDRFATVDAEFFREGSDRRGRQSQSWVKFPDGWKVVSAHVSLEGTTH